MSETRDEEEPLLAVNERIQHMLQQTGLDAYPMDPASLEALKEILQGEDDLKLGALRAKAPPAANIMERTPPPSTPQTQRPPLGSIIRPSPWQRAVSDITTTIDPFAAGIEEDATDASVAPALSVEDRILRQLHQQTQLLLRLQERVDELYELVHTANSNSNNNTDGRADMSPSVEDFLNQARAVRDHVPRQQPERVIIRPPPAVNNNNNAPVAPAPFFFVTTKLKRIYHFCHLIFALHAAHIQELNVGLFVKLLFFVSMFLARFTSRRETSEEMSLLRIYRFYFLVAVMVAGFVVQAGVFNSYEVLVKQNYVQRIIVEGEVTDIAEETRIVLQELRQRPAPVRPAANAAANGEDPRLLQQPAPFARPAWQAAILAGQIPRDINAGPLTPLLEVLAFFVTFFLSIFPHWHPEVPPQPPAAPAPPQEEQVERSDDEDDYDDDDNDDTDFGLPDIHPPRNVLEPVDEDDE